MTAQSRALAALADDPAVSAAIDAARQACDELRWHPVLRRRTAQAAVESRVRGARASAELDGARVPVELVRDLWAGRRTWPVELDPVEATLRGAMQVSAATEDLTGRSSPAVAQDLARLHVAATSWLLPPNQRGRPRRPGEHVAELADLGPAPDHDLAARLLQVGELLRLAEAPHNTGAVASPERVRAEVGSGAQEAVPALVVAAIVHAEIATLRPFAGGNGLVARAAERIVLQRGGLDPTGVAVPEAGHLRTGGTAYLGALTAYGEGTVRGVRLWIEQCALAVVAGAEEGRRLCDAIAAG